MPYGLMNLGTHSITPISLPRGRYGTIGFIADNGLQGEPPVQLRVGIHTGSGNWKIQNVTVDSANGQTVVTFDDKANTDALSLSYDNDPGVVPVAYEIS